MSGGAVAGPGLESTGALSGDVPNGGNAKADDEALGLRHHALWVLIAGVATLADQRWLLADEGVQFTDAAFHWAQVAERWGALQQGPAAIAALSASDEQQRYGALYYWLSAGLAQVFGPEPAALLRSWSPLLWLSLVGLVAGIGHELGPPGRRRWTALCAASAVPLLPGLFDYTRVFVLDVPLTIGVLLTNLGALRAVRTPQRRAPWALTAAGAMLALAIKVNALAFILGPVFVALRQARRQTLGGRTHWWPLLAIAAAASAILVGSRGAHVLETALDATWPGQAVAYASLGILHELPGHWWASVRTQGGEVLYYTLLQTLLPFWVALSVLASVWFFGRRAGCVDPLARTQRLAIFWWLVPGPTFAVLLQRSLYDERYLLPVVPLTAILVATSLADIGPTVLRWLGACAILGVGALLAVHHGFGWASVRGPLWCRTIEGPWDGPRVTATIDLCALYPEPTFLDRPARPRTDPWPTQVLEDRLAAASSALGRPLSAVFLDDLYELFYRVHQRDTLALVRGESPVFDPASALLLDRCWDEGALRDGHGSVARIDDRIAESDVVVMRWGARPGKDQILRGRRCLPFWAQQHRFVLGGEVPLRDGTAVRFYQRFK